MNSFVFCIISVIFTLKCNAQAVPDIADLPIIDWQSVSVQEGSQLSLSCPRFLSVSYLYFNQSLRNSTIIARCDSYSKEYTCLGTLKLNKNSGIDINDVNIDVATDVRLTLNRISMNAAGIYGCQLNPTMNQAQLKLWNVTVVQRNKSNLFELLTQSSSSHVQGTIFKIVLIFAAGMILMNMIISTVRRALARRRNRNIQRQRQAPPSNQSRVMLVALEEAPPPYPGTVECDAVVPVPIQPDERPPAYPGVEEQASLASQPKSLAANPSKVHTSN